MTSAMALRTPATAPATLGFGTGSLGSVIGYRAGCLLVEAAFDAGFRHFDVAPPYGNGAAECILGDVLASVRAQVVLVSKVGFMHPRGGGLVNVLRRVASPLKQALPGLWGRAAQRTRLLTAPAGSFTPAEIKASIAESLRRLRTDRLDALLLHEASAQALADNTVVALLDAQREGLVGGLGTGTGLAATLDLHTRYADWLSWAQVPHWPAAFDPRLRRPSLQLCTHGSLRTAAPFLAALGMTPDAHVDELRQALADPPTRVRLLVQSALHHVGPGGVVVVSTTRADHARELARVAADALPADLINSMNDGLAAAASKSDMSFMPA